MKICSKCKEEKPLEAFSKHKNGKLGLDPSCKTCHTQKYLRYKEESPGALQASRLKTQLKRFYNMTPERYFEILTSQGGLCAICETDDPGSNRNRFCVDHNHACCPGQFTCGECVRGLICEDCNQVLGRSRDNPQTLRSAALYLEGRDQWLGLDQADQMTNPRIR